MWHCTGTRGCGRVRRTHATQDTSSSKKTSASQGGVLRRRRRAARRVGPPAGREGFRYKWTSQRSSRQHFNEFDSAPGDTRPAAAAAAQARENARASTAHHTPAGGSRVGAGDDRGRSPSTWCLFLHVLAPLAATRGLSRLTSGYGSGYFWLRVSCASLRLWSRHWHHTRHSHGDFYVLNARRSSSWHGVPRPCSDGSHPTALTRPRSAHAHCMCMFGCHIEVCDGDVACKGHSPLGAWKETRAHPHWDCT